MSEEKKPFVATPHEIKNYMLMCKRNATQNAILNAIDRFTFGFGQEWARLSLSVLAVLSDSDKRQVTRELKVLIDEGVVLELKKGKNRYLKFNPDIGISNEDMFTKLKLAFNGDSLTTIIGDSFTTIDGGESTTHIKKEKETIKKDNNNTSNFSNSMASFYLTDYESDHKEDVENALQHYYDSYREKMGKSHPKLKQDQLYYAYEQIENVISEGYYDIEATIDEFFTTVKSRDYNLNHFVSDGIIHTLKERTK